MAINKPIIDAGPTHTRQQVKTVVGQITSAAPPADRVYIDSNGDIVAEDQQPQVEGQMLFYKDGTSTVVQMYVVVLIGEELTWKTVLPTAQMQNAANAQPWDPLAGFYDPLVS